MHALTRALATARSVLLTAPGNLDGDAVGALVALARALPRRWPAARVWVVTADAPGPRDAFLTEPEVVFVRPERAPEMPAARASGGSPGLSAAGPVAGGDPPVFDVAVVVDGDAARLGPLAPWVAAARHRALIDHHRSSRVGDFHSALLDPQASSSTELVLGLLDHWGVALDAALAAPIYAGLVADTSQFRYRLTRPAALRAAARLLETGIDHAAITERVLLDQSPAKARLRSLTLGRYALHHRGRLALAGLEAEEVAGGSSGGLVDDLVFIEGVQVGALLLGHADGTVRLSLRSKGAVDVSAVAGGLDPQGGGHARAAGARLAGPLAEAERRVVAALGEALGAGAAATA